MVEFSKLPPKLKSSILMHISGLLLCLSVFSYMVFTFVSCRYNRLTYDVVPVDPYEAHFNTYLKSFGKQYQVEEYRRRLNNFKRSSSEIERLNSYHDEPIFGWTKFSDMTPEEFDHKMLLPAGSMGGECKDVKLSCDHNKANTVEEQKSKNIPIPDIFDWRDDKVVGPVLDQGMCLSCWAFSVVGVMESMLVISNLTHSYQRLSIQELVDCSTYTSQCRAGNVVKVLKYLCNEPLAIIPEAQYPLTNKDEDCKIHEKSYSGISVSNMVSICDMDAKEIARLVATHGPVVTVVQAYVWQNYLNGVIRFHCSGNWDLIKHVVQIVGYDMTAEVPYFILRNSWGADFGDKGYVKVAMDGFVCGVGRQISYFDVTKIKISDRK
ncbi:cathepsin O-like [Pectinophora gossypiella]|uniref:cathepsin O-like n=1 Tax=Pectinophora gossypiella TaxID=13191 RepID=UPI00214F4813|nr:cathepsin O-like [Pectinophora gossypiella]